MPTYSQTLAYLYSLQSRGMKFGLRNIRALVASAGNPHKAFPAVHIAGTNGKGSTASFLASIFKEAGYKTALYTSPHLVRFTERIRIDGIEMQEKRLVAYAQRLRPMIEEHHATFFEATTCIAFQYFADEQVDIAIVEVGLGGRLDSTNIITPLVSIITNITLDHQEYLGNTTEKIAREKGGIIKRGVPCVTASRNVNVLRALRGIARRRRAPLHQVRRVHGRIRKRQLGLTGEHQLLNAATAVRAVRVMLQEPENRRRFSRVTDLAVRNGLRFVRENTGIRGRYERFNRQCILDVAHNPDGLRTLINALPPAVKSSLIVVFGVMADKDFREMIEIVGSVAKHLVAVKPRSARALAVREITKRADAFGCPTTSGRSVARGVQRARRIAGKNDTILITGSNYVVGEALEELEKRPQR